MKKIAGYIRGYFRDEFHPLVFFPVVSLLALVIYADQKWDWLDVYITSLGRNPLRIFALAAFYFSPWLCVVILNAAVKNNFSVLKNRELWILVFAAVFILGIKNWFWLQNEIGDSYFHGHARYVVKRAGWNLKNILIFLIPLLLLHFTVLKNRDSFFGLTRKNFDPRPYLFLLLVALPAIVIASGTEGFLHSYPQFRPSKIQNLFGMPAGMELGLYEVLYAFDISMVEIFFRGFLVIGLSKYLGKSSILPMAAMYCLFHLGKPVPEIASSFFGGLILGTIAYETRSVLGGVMVHSGIAWMMDISAFLRSY